MIAIGAGAVESLEIDARARVGSMTSLILASIAHNFNIILEWYVVVVARRARRILRQLVNVRDTCWRRRQDSQAPVSRFLLLHLSRVDVFIIIVI